MIPPRLPSVTLLWLVVCLSWAVGHGAAEFIARSYRSPCPVDPEIITLQRDPVSGQYMKMDSEGQERRQLVVGPIIMVQERNGLRGAPDDDDELVLNAVERTLLSEETAQVRSCTCHSYGPVYCPLSVDHCAVIRRYNATLHGALPLGCIDPSERQDEFAKTTFLIVVLWLSILISCLCGTHWGRQVLHFFLSLCIPKYNERFLSWFLLRTDRELAQVMIQRQVNMRRRLMLQRLEQVTNEMAAEAMNDQNNLNQTRHPVHPPPQKRQPEALALKTRIFASDEEETQEKNNGKHDQQGHGEEEDDVLDHNCIICFQPLESGDRVGDLACQHVFHVECLKTWLKRRNTCPLCNAEEIGVARYSDEVNPPEEETQPASESQTSSSVTPSAS